MPQYHLPVNGPVVGIGYYRLDDFTRGYIEAMFFTSCSDPDDGDLEGMGFEDLSPQALDQIRADCEEFQANNASLLAQAIGHADEPYDMERAGNDFWYSRNGHGVGFWDRGLGSLGDRLHDACKYHEVSPYLGDDGKVHLS